MLTSEIAPVTKEGARFVELAEQHAAEFRDCAGDHDRENRFPVEHVEAMRESGFLAGTVPEEFGGMGVSAGHDAVLAINRLARADASLANGVNMQLNSLAWPVAYDWRSAKAAGLDHIADRLGGLLALIGSKTLTFALPASEPGTDLLHPMTEAVPEAGAWKVNGRKIFATLSPGANVIGITVRLRGVGETDRMGFAMIPVGTPGMTFNDDWDALGMRGSGSQSITFADCPVDGEMIMPMGEGTPWGDFTPDWSNSFTFGALGLGGVSLGIAESAHETILAALAGRTKGPSKRLVASRYAIQQQAAENEIELAAMRALFARTAASLGAFYEERLGTLLPADELHRPLALAQTGKVFLNLTACRVVDRALTMSGGAGYMSNNVLSRLYRDVRAGPFMQPFSPNEAHEYIGKVALGLPVDDVLG